MLKKPYIALMGLFVLACTNAGEGGVNTTGFQPGTAPPANTAAPPGSPNNPGGPGGPGGGNGGTGNTGNTTGSGGTTGGDCMSVCQAKATECEQDPAGCAQLCPLNPDVSCLQSLSCDGNIQDCLGGSGGTTGSGGTPPTGGAGGVGATGGLPNTGGSTSSCTPADQCAGCPDQTLGPSECLQTCTCAVAAGLVPSTTDCPTACGAG